MCRLSKPSLSRHINLFFAVRKNTDRLSKLKQLRKDADRAHQLHYTTEYCKHMINGSNRENPFPYAIAMFLVSMILGVIPCSIMLFFHIKNDGFYVFMGFIVLFTYLTLYCLAHSIPHRKYLRAIDKLSKVDE